MHSLIQLLQQLHNYGYDYSDGDYSYYNTTRKSEVESSFATIFLTFNVLF